jgi:hypothetical protein
MTTALTPTELIHHWTQVQQTMLACIARAPTEAERMAAARRLAVINKTIADLRERAAA